MRKKNFAMQNPFIENQDELTVSRDDDTRFLGKSMFWKHLEFMHPKYLYRPNTVEYRTVKVMIIESILIVLAAAFFTGHVVLAFSAPVHKHVVSEVNYWGDGLDSLQTVDAVWEWLSTEFVPKLFVQDSAYADVTPVVTPPSGWLNMSIEESDAYIRANGMFEVSASNPGWTPHYLNDDPFEGAILLGTVRIRQIVSESSSDCYIGDLCYWNDAKESSMDKTVLIGTPSEILSPFSYTSANVTQQASHIRGRFNDYSAGGFVYDFPLSKADSLAQLDLLRQWSWVDPSTRALILEFSSLNSRIESIVSNVILIEFNNGVYSTQSQIPIWLFRRGFTGNYFLEIITFAIFVGYALYYFWLIFQSGILDFFTYFWNYIDIVNNVLFFSYLSLQQHIPNTLPSVLSPVLGALPDVFFPFSTYQNRMLEISRIASVLSILLWIRVIKCCLLISGLRHIIRVFETSCFRLIFVFAQFSLGFTGILLAWSISFSPASFFFQSPSATWTSLWVLTFGGLHDSEFFFSTEQKPMLAVLFSALTVLMCLYLPSIVFGTILHEFRSYSESVKLEQENIAADSMALYPVGIDRRSFWHTDPVRIFAYTWYHRMKGIDLIKEREEDVGSPDEQVIDVDLLPEFLQTKWAAKRAELDELMSARKLKANNMDQRKQSLFGRALTQGVANVYARANSMFRGRGRTMTSAFSATSPARDTSRITRIQLQRLLDIDPDIAEMLREAEVRENLGAVKYPTKIRGIDIIRKYTSKESLNRRMIFENLLGDIDGEATSPDEVKKGLIQVVNHLNSAWKQQLSDIAESCNELKIELVSLKAKLEQNQIGGKGYPSGYRRPSIN